MALMVWKMSTSPSTLTLSTSHIAAMNTPVRDMPSLTKKEVNNILLNFIHQYIKFTKSSEYSVELWCPQGRLIRELWSIRHSEQSMDNNSMAQEHSTQKQPTRQEL